MTSRGGPSSWDPVLQTREWPEITLFTLTDRNFPASIAEKLIEELEKDPKIRKRLAELMVTDSDVRLAIINAVLADVATKSDLEKLEAATKRELENLRVEMKAEMEKLEERLRSEMGKLEERLRS